MWRDEFFGIMSYSVNVALYGISYYEEIIYDLVYKGHFYV